MLEALTKNLNLLKIMKLIIMNKMII